MNYKALRELAAGLAKKAPRDDALAIARRNAAKPASDGGLGLRPDNTAMERAEALGFLKASDVNPEGSEYWLHGTPSGKIEAFQAGQKRNPATNNAAWRVFTTNDPAEAGFYSKGGFSRGGSISDAVEAGDSPTVYPLMIGGNWKHNPKSDFGSESVGNFTNSGSDKEWAVAGSPKLVRSRFAAFDPARRNESDLLAGIAPYAAPAAVVGAGALAPTDEAEAGIAGTLAKTANLDMLKVAQLAEKQGLNASRIYDATGWARGADGKWRWEFDDSAAKLGNDALDLRRYERKGAKFVLDDLSNTLQNPAAYAAYPDLKGVQVQHNLGGIPGEGMYSPASDRITMEGSTLGHATGDVKPVLGHETQHAIQGREGFAKGGDSKEFLRESNSIKMDLEDQIDAINSQLSRAVGTPRYSDLIDLRSKLDADLRKQGLLDPIGMREAAHGKYRRLAGEVEARNVEGRMGMSADDRRMRPFMDTEDVPRELQIVRGATGEPAASMSKSDALRELRTHKPMAPAAGLKELGSAAKEIANPINWASAAARTLPAAAAIEGAVYPRELGRPEDLVLDEATGEWMTPEQAAKKNSKYDEDTAELMRQISARIGK